MREHVEPPVWAAESDPAVRDRTWTDADRELLVSVLWTRALQANNAGPRLDRQPAADAPAHLWADAAAVLDALAAAGRLADPQEQERLREALATRTEEATGWFRQLERVCAERDGVRAELARMAGDLDDAHGTLAMRTGQLQDARARIEELEADR